jgi:oligo-1,6-glucosidase
VWSGSAWEWDELTEEVRHLRPDSRVGTDTDLAFSEQYYLHLYLPEQPDLHWENPETREVGFGRFIDSADGC